MWRCWARELEKLAESQHGALRRPAARALISARALLHEGWANVQLLAFSESLSPKNIVLVGAPRAPGVTCVALDRLRWYLLCFCLPFSLCVAPLF